jgi:hypothetical protein
MCIACLASGLGVIFVDSYFCVAVGKSMIGNIAGGAEFHEDPLKLLGLVSFVGVDTTHCVAPGWCS